MNAKRLFTGGSLNDAAILDAYKKGFLVSEPLRRFLADVKAFNIDNSKVIGEAFRVYSWDEVKYTKKQWVPASVGMHLLSTTRGLASERQIANQTGNSVLPTN